MTNFDKLKNMTAEELAEFIDKHGIYDDTPWMNWFYETYCNNCESIIVGAEDAEEILGIKPFYNEEYECAHCEVYEDCCKFFPNRCPPNNRDIIKMWLEAEND